MADVIARTFKAPQDRLLIAFASKNGHLEKLANEKENKKAIEYLST